MIHPLNCGEVTRKLALGDIGQYDFADRFMIRFHLVICWVCRKYERQMKVIGRTFARAMEQKEKSLRSPEFKERLIKRLHSL